MDDDVTPLYGAKESYPGEMADVLLAAGEAAGRLRDAFARIAGAMEREGVPVEARRRVLRAVADGEHERAGEPPFSPELASADPCDTGEPS